MLEEPPKKGSKWLENGKSKYLLRSSPTTSESEPVQHYTPIGIPGNYVGAQVEVGSEKRAKYNCK